VEDIHVRKSVAHLGIIKRTLKDIIFAEISVLRRSIVANTLVTKYAIKVSVMIAMLILAFFIGLAHVVKLLNFLLLIVEVDLLFAHLTVQRFHPVVILLILIPAIGKENVLLVLYLLKRAVQEVI